jgi:hypothetical protein
MSEHKKRGKWTALDIPSLKFKSSFKSLAHRIGSIRFEDPHWELSEQLTGLNIPV